MKITLEPTDNQRTQQCIKSGIATGIFSTVTIDHPLDDMNISDVFECIIMPALKAYGFPESLVDSYLRNDDTLSDPRCL